MFLMFSAGNWLAGAKVAPLPYVPRLTEVSSSTYSRSFPGSIRTYANV